MGAVVTLRTSPIAWTLMVFDPDNRTNDYWPDDFFGNGVDVSLSANYAGEMFGHMSSVTVTGTYTTKDGANLGELLLPPDLQTGRQDHSWYISVQFGHYLHESPGQQGVGWGVFLKTAASDGNPNPFQASIMGGVGGKGLFATRPNDTFGVGYFYVDFSDDLQSSLNPLVTFQDEQGVEAFYSYLATEWLHVAADLQYVDPALGDANDALVAGLRATIRF
jgi:porin